MVDARLPDGSRVNIIIPPLAPRSAVITIRKFRQDRLTIEDLVSIGTMPETVATLLAGCVRAKLNIVVSGGTGSGKTTLLNALSAYLPHTERIVTIEDPLELKLQQRHVVPLEARPASLEGKGEVTQRDLLRNTLRMRPDRIIIGEVRGPEALDMLQAMNTGHEGSMTTVHANSPRDALRRIENMVSMAGLQYPVHVIRDQMSSTLDLLIQVSRLTGGRRKVVSIVEINGMERDVILMQELFQFRQTGIDGDGHAIGTFEACGVRPRLLDRMVKEGLEVPAGIFQKRRITA